ncbi:hypothetical protein MTO96_006663 [Rhipicephalus appendiculatus]
MNRSLNKKRSKGRWCDADLCLVSGTGAEAERVREFQSHCRSGAVHPNLRGIYVEVASDQNFQQLSKFLRVHFVLGNFLNILTECRAIFAEHVGLETVTFTSERASHLERTTPFDFTDYVVVCAQRELQQVHQLVAHDA